MTRPAIQVPPEGAAPLTAAQMIALVSNAGGHFAADQDFFWQLSDLFEAIFATDSLKIVRGLAQVGMDLANTAAGDCEDLAAIYVSEAERAFKEANHG